MRKHPRRAVAATAAREDPGRRSETGRGGPDARWRVWLPDAEAEPERSNACVGIAVALAMSLPIWLVVGAVVYVLAT